MLYMLMYLLIQTVLAISDKKLGIEINQITYIISILYFLFILKFIPMYIFMYWCL